MKGLSVQTREEGVHYAERVFAALTPWVLLWATLWIAWQILAIATFAGAQARRVR